MDGAIIVNDDITYRRQVERLMRRNEQLLERVLENLPEGVAITDDRGQYIMTNDSDARIWGFDRVDNRAHEVPGFAHREGGQGEVDEGDWPVDRVLSSAEPVQGDILEVIRRSDGDRRWLSCSAAPVFSSDQNLWGVVELVHDVTAERQQQAERRKLANAVDHAADAIFVLDALCCLEFCNPAFRAITGYSLDDVLGKRPEEFLNHGPDVVTGCQRMQQLASEGENGREVITVRDSKDRLRQWDCTVSLIFDDDNRTVNYLVSATDLSEDDRIRKELYRATRYDALTGLSNRAQMQEQLEQALAGSGYRPHVTGLVKMDIVGFSMINEKHGMDLGDQILRELACRLHGATREGDVLARTSGDSFKVLLTDVASEDDVPLVVEKLLAVFDENMVIDGEEVPCKVNTGVAVAPTDGTDAETLVRHVNVALARARQEEARVRFYAEQQGYLARRQLSLEVALREAIDQEQFELYFQPQINLQSGGMRGLETLLRWEHPDLGTISPGEFIPLAERTGLIAQLSPWVLRQALLQRAAWRAAGFDPGRVAVNLSARDFGDPTLPERVRGILEQTGETAEGLELEITETMLMERGDAQLNTLKELSNMGITISVDDFGTGYSSLAYLSVLPISLLKIDRSFINSVHYQTDTNASIIRSIVSMAQSLGLDVVAEGVETRWQLDFLKQLRCEVAQGFFLARPAPAWQIEEGLDKSTWLTA